MVKDKKIQQKKSCSADKVRQMIMGKGKKEKKKKNKPQ